MASTWPYVLASGLILLVFQFVNSMASPCTDYIPINEPKRSNRHILAKGEKAICDSQLAPGWYRFTMARQAQMPTTEPENRHCSTLAPMWIVKGTHPDTEGEEVQAVACAKIDSGIKRCMYPRHVLIKNCGNYYVYYLQPTPNRCMAYCAELTDKQHQVENKSGRKIRSLSSNGCSSKNNSCLISGNCYFANDVNPQNWCQQCMPDIRNDTWSARKDNQPPSFAQGQGAPRYGIVGEDLPLQLVASDPENRNVTFSLLSTDATSGYSLSPSGLLRISVKAQYMNFTIAVTDECNARDTINVKLNYMLCHCKNGGQCKPLPRSPRGSGHYTCECLKGFSGDTCENNIDDCVAVDCGNGTCIDGINNYTCKCHVGFEGPSCDQKIHNCTKQSCFAGVQCTETSSGISCGPCPYGMSGDGKTCTGIPGIVTTTTSAKPTDAMTTAAKTTTAATTAAKTTAAAATTALPTTTSPPTTTDTLPTTTMVTTQTTAPPPDTTTVAPTTAEATTSQTTTKITTQETTTTAAPTTHESTTAQVVTTYITTEMQSTQKPTEQPLGTTVAAKSTPIKEIPTEEIPRSQLYVVRALMSLTLEWNEDYSLNNTDAFKSLKNLLIEKIVKAYDDAGDENFYKVWVVAFSQGSVIADLELAFKNKTDSPLEALRSAIKNGSLYGLEADPGSVQIKEKDTEAVSEPKDRGPNVVLIVILVIIAALIIVVIAVTCYIRKKNKRKEEITKRDKDDGSPAETIPLTEKNNK